MMSWESMTSDGPGWSKFVFNQDGTDLVYPTPDDVRVAVDVQVEVYHSIGQFNVGMVQPPPEIYVSVYVPFESDFARRMKHCIVLGRLFTYCEDDWAVEDIMLINMGTAVFGNQTYTIFNGRGLCMKHDAITKIRAAKTKQQIIHEILAGEKSAHIKQDNGLDLLL